MKINEKVQIAKLVYTEDIAICIKRREGEREEREREREREKARVS